MPAAVAWVGWWLASAALWLLLVDKTQSQELVLGAFVAAVAASAAVLVRSQRDRVGAYRARWLTGALRPLAGLVTDLPKLVRALRRPGAGALTEVPFEVVGDAPAEHGYRMLTTALGSMAPNTVVVDLDKEGRTLLVHQLEPTADPARAACPLPPYEERDA